MQGAKRELSEITLRSSESTVRPLYLWVLHPQIQPTKDQKYSEEKNSRMFQKAKLEFATASNYLHSIYIIFTTIYIAFTLVQVF